MKRWLVIALVVLALVVLVSPGIIGRIAERNLAQNVDRASSESPAVEISTERFDRGWFTSEGRHRVQLNANYYPMALAEYSDRTGNPGLPSLIIDTHLDHGLVPVGDAGSLAPGLANLLSTFQLDPGNGELVDLPGTLRSKIGLAGDSDSHFLLESGQFANEMGRIEWSGADVAMQSGRSAGSLVIDGDIQAVTVEANGERLRLESVTLDANQRRGDYGFNVGTISLDFGPIVVDSPRNPLSVNRMLFAAEADVEDERLDFHSRVSIDELTNPVGQVSLFVDMAMKRLDATAMQRIIEAIRRAQSSPDPDRAMAALPPQIQGDIERVVASGTEIRIDQLDVSLPQGNLDLELEIDIPATADADAFSWSGALLSATAKADVRMSAALFEMAAAMNPDLNAALGMGFLQRDGEDYVMNAEYAKGMLNINGAPMPIPMPAM